MTPITHQSSGSSRGPGPRRPSSPPRGAADSGPTTACRRVGAESAALGRGPNPCLRAAFGQFDDRFRGAAEEEFFGLFLARSGDLSGDAGGLRLVQAFGVFFELPFEGFAEGFAVVVGEAFDLVELPVAVFFDQRDFQRL